MSSNITVMGYVLHDLISYYAYYDGIISAIEYFIHQDCSVLLLEIVNHEIFKNLMSLISWFRSVSLNSAGR